MITLAQQNINYPTQYFFTYSGNKWLIDYEKYGGYEEYQRIKNKYWELAQQYINTKTPYGPFNFPIMDREDYYALLQLREDLIMPERYDNN